MLQFGLKDALDIILVALFLFYLYKLMKVHYLKYDYKYTMLC